MTYQQPTSLTSRDAGINNVAYSGREDAAIFYNKRRFKKFPRRRGSQNYNFSFSSLYNFEPKFFILILIFSITFSLVLLFCLECIFIKGIFLTHLYFSTGMKSVTKTLGSFSLVFGCNFHFK